MVAKQQLKQRRRVLRQQRRLHTVQSFWRFGCMLGILTGVGWMVSQVSSTIAKPEQVRVKGNNYLSDTAIRSMMGMRYPQPLLEIEPAQLKIQLLSGKSIVSATIDRVLLPPHLTVQVVDLRPVAVAIRDLSSPPTLFIDERGVETPIANYLPNVQRSAPRLRLLEPERGICPNWADLYSVIETSPVAIGTIDCRNPQNLFLQTEVGKVRLGNIGTKQLLIDRIKQLDRLRNWQKSYDASRIDYLDLESPNSSPKLKLKPINTPSLPASQVSK